MHSMNDAVRQSLVMTLGFNILHNGNSLILASITQVIRVVKLKWIYNDVLVNQRETLL